jgi:Protein of unknown function (DUF3014)
MAHPEGTRSPRGARIAVAVLLAGAFVSGWAVVRLRSRQDRPSPPDVTVGTGPTSGGASLEEEDRLVRELVGDLTKDPQVSLWLSGHGLVRAMATAVAKVAVGETPVGSLRALAPRQPFRVVQERSRTLIDPRSYRRYDAVAEGFASLDAAGCARAFRRLEPLFEAAYREDGHPEGGFRFALARAVSSLLDTPLAAGDTGVVPRVHVGVGSANLPESAVLVYEFADPKAEALSPAQKQLLRMGPQNARLVQSKLEELAGALELSLHRAKG